MSDLSPESRIGARRSDIDESHSLLIVLSGPSGVGKDSVLARMKDLKRPFHYVVTATTRPRRVAEKDGVDYRFLSRQEFQRLLDEKGFLEWATVYGNHYGVPKEQLASALSRGQDVIVKVDVQGAATIKKLVPGAVLIFIMPPSTGELERRLKSRTSESPGALDLRLKTASDEMESLPLFDYVIVNHPDKIDDVVFQIDAIVTAERCRMKPRAVEL
jgi:guanylate kinase